MAKHQIEYEGHAIGDMVWIWVGWCKLLIQVKILGMTWAVHTKKAAARGHSSYMFVRHGITNVAGCRRQKRP